MFKKHLGDPLFKNSYFLMLSTLTSSFSGLFFWIVAARFYSANEVGLAVAIISPMGLIGVLSLMGFDISLIKYIPEIKDKGKLINTCFSTTFIVSSLLTFIYLLGIELWSPSLLILKNNLQFSYLFIIFSLILPLQSLQNQGIFVGFRKTKYSFYQAIITLIRIILVPFLVTYGAIGIFAPYGLMPLISFFVGIFFIKKMIPISFKFEINKKILTYIFSFSCGNYISRIFETLPTFLLPLIVINQLGAEQNAYFYIAWQMSMLILIISKAVSSSLFAEILNNGENKGKLIIKAMKFIFTLVIFFIIGIFLFGKYLLMLFGNEYVNNSFNLLCIFAFASIPFSFNTVCVGVSRSKGDILTPIAVYGLVAVLCITGSYALITSFELLGVAYSWVAANTIVAIILMIKTKNLKTLFC